MATKIQDAYLSDKAVHASQSSKGMFDTTRGLIIVMHDRLILPEQMDITIRGIRSNAMDVGPLVRTKCLYLFIESPIEVVVTLPEKEYLVISWKNE